MNKNINENTLHAKSASFRFFQLCNIYSILWATHLGCHQQLFEVALYC